MPAPQMQFPVQDTPQGRRIYREQAEAEMNRCLNELFNLVSNIPSGPQGDRGPTGAQGPRWIIGTPRAHSEGLQCLEGNIVYRLYPTVNMTGVFRCTISSTISQSNFPTSPATNTNWELIMVAPWGERGLQGIQGVQGIQGTPGASAEVIEFNNDAEAAAYAASHPLALVVSTEGM